MSTPLQCFSPCLHQDLCVCVCVWLCMCVFGWVRGPWHRSAATSLTGFVCKELSTRGRWRALSWLTSTNEPLLTWRQCMCMCVCVRALLSGYHIVCLCGCMRSRYIFVCVRRRVCVAPWIELKAGRIRWRRFGRWEEARVDLRVSLKYWRWQWGENQVQDALQRRSSYSQRSCHQIPFFPNLTLIWLDCLMWDRLSQFVTGGLFLSPSCPNLFGIWWQRKQREVFTGWLVILFKKMSWIVWDNWQ